MKKVAKTLSLFNLQKTYPGKAEAVIRGSVRHDFVKFPI